MINTAMRASAKINQQLQQEEVNSEYDLDAYDQFSLPDHHEFLQEVQPPKPKPVEIETNENTSSDDDDSLDEATR